MGMHIMGKLTEKILQELEEQQKKEIYEDIYKNKTIDTVSESDLTDRQMDKQSILKQNAHDEMKREGFTQKLQESRAKQNTRKEL
jgi:hypothetical protein